MKDFFINKWLRLKSFFRYLASTKPKINFPEGTNYYVLKFESDFKNDIIDESIWHIGQPWGEFHPDHLYQYYGKTSDFVSVKNSELLLCTKYQPKEFYNPKTSSNVTIPYGIGLVNSKLSFKYGYYEFEAMLPKGRFLWPAIWLTAVKTWPPEIDILEAYSGNDGQYRNKKGYADFRNEPNIHYGFVENGTKSNFGGISFPIPNRPCERFVRYGLHWTENFIKVYYDGHFVFQCTQKSILDYFNRQDVSMSIILNNAVQAEISNTITESSVFRIKSVKYFSKS